MMTAFGQDKVEGLALAARVQEKYGPVWDAVGPDEAAALALYFLPHRSEKPALGPTRPRVIKFYCPFADQRGFFTGHRYCINVYTGCGHKCRYCYAAGYEPDQPGCKKNFRRHLQRDLDDLDRYEVPAAPVHLSNSTDPFQPLEAENADSLFALEQVLRRRHRFTTVTLLTKNPLCACQPEYVELLEALMDLPAGHPRRDDFARRALPGLRVEVSLAFRRDEVRAAYDVGAPSVDERVEGVRRLRERGIPVVLRIDPLLPRNPIGDRTLGDFDLPEAQPLEDLEHLVALAAEVGAMHVVYSVAKIVRPRFQCFSPIMQDLKRAYEYLAAPVRLPFRGGSWRLPPEVARAQVTGPFLALCREHAVLAKFCKQNLVETP